MTDIPTRLDEPDVALPAFNTPVYWAVDQEVEHNMNKMELWIDDYKRYLPGGKAIDEVAVLTPSPWHADRLIEDLVAQEWEHFNSADDLVYTTPFGTRYFVHYEFLRNAQANWRLEVMHMGVGKSDGQTGFSPLHQALWSPNGNTANTAGAYEYPVPHLSFKCTPTAADQSNRSCYSRAVGHLQHQGLIHAQTCQSTYGVFGYYLPNDAEHQLYLKPRANLRDAQ